MSLNLLKLPLIKPLFMRSLPPRAKLKYERFKQYLNPGERLLEVGCGNGGLAHYLQQEGFSLQALDVQNLSFYKEVTPTIYDGSSFPFADKSFDTVLIITVLHHTRTQREILLEAQRVANKVIIMEDVYDSWLQKQLTLFFDSLVNLEFIGHPHSNRNHEDWMALFRELGFNVADFRIDPTALLFKQSCYKLICP